MGDRLLIFLRYIKEFARDEDDEDETLFEEETTSPLSDFHKGPPYKDELITTIIVNNISKDFVKL